jgi:ligand-binding sensor domain-containing protein
VSVVFGRKLPTHPFERVEPNATANGAGPTVNSVLEDRRGAPWLGTSFSLYWRGTDGQTVSCGHFFGPKPVGVLAILEDREGRMWLGTTPGLWRIDPAAIPLRVLDSNLWVSNLLQSSDGRIWIGTTSFLAEWSPRAGNLQGRL